MHPRVRTVLAIAVSASLFLAASALEASAPRSPITVSLKLTTLDPVSRAGEVEVEVVSSRDASGTQVELILPAGATADKAAWSFDLKAGEPVLFDAAFILGAKTGNTEVGLRARKEFDPRNAWGDMKTISLHVQSVPGSLQAGTVAEEWVVEKVPVAALDKPGDALVLSMEPVAFAFPDRAAGPAACESQPSTQPLRPGEAAPEPPSYAQTVTLTGRWQYGDRSGVVRDFDQQLLEVVRADGSRIGGGVFCYTDGAGFFTCPLAHPGTDMRVYIRSKTTFGSATGDVNLGVYSGVNITGGGCGSDSIDCTYPVTTGAVSCPDGATCNVGAYIVSAAEGEPWLGAHQMTQDLIRAYKRVLFGAVHPGSQNSGWARISYPAFGGPVYQSGGLNDHWISIPPPWQTAADVVVHEYGHAVMRNIWFGKIPAWPTNDCPAAGHALYFNSGPGCALSEGFANFLPLYANQFYDGDSLTANDGPILDDPGTSSDMENFTPGNTGDMVEGNFAAALWDMYDATNEGVSNTTGTDRMSDGIGHIWHSFSDFSADNVAGWWTDYKSVSTHDQGTALSALRLNTIDYGYVPNDICGNASNAFPIYFNSITTTQATTDSIEPAVTCGNSSRGKSVWYRALSSTPGWWSVNTFSSSYDTIVQAYTGSCGAPTPVSGGCSDDAAGGVQSELLIPNVPGQTFYFMVTAYSSNGGGLVFRLDKWNCLNDSHCDTNIYCKSSYCSLTPHQCAALAPACNDNDPCTSDTCVDARALCIFSPDPALDPDGDGYCATLDGCPSIFDPDQLDFDGDGAGDVCDADDDNDLVLDPGDCAALDPLAWGIPGDVPAIATTSVPFALSWDSQAADLGPGAVYDVLRGDLAAFPVGATAAESCMGGTTAPILHDGTNPPPDSGLWYLVRPRNACGIGSYGVTSDGVERTSQTCQ